MRAIRRNPRKGVVLLAVLVVVVLLSLAAYKYSDYMLSEYRANESALRAAQARLAADSSVHYVAAMLAAGDQALGGNPYENPQVFQNIQVPSTDPNARPLRFTVVSLRSPEELNSGTPYRFGVEDEGAKINLNALLALDRNRGGRGLQLLKGLPNMSEDIAKSILAWLGCTQYSTTESTYYSSQQPPYRMKNGPLDSLEELLLVRGVTPELLFGNDRNRNGVLDPDEMTGGGAVDLGWSAYLTVYSREANADITGKARLNVNGQDLTLLSTQLTEAVGTDLATYMLAYRLYGGSQIGATQAMTATITQSSTGVLALQLTQPQTTTTVPLTDSNRAAVMSKIQTDIANAGQKKMQRVRSLWSLVNSQVNVTIMANGKSQTVAFPSPLNVVEAQRTLLPQLLDRCTTSNRTDLNPRINVATASPTVLYCLKESTGLTDADITSILAKRPTADVAGTDLLYKTTAWLMSECNLPQTTLSRLDPYITGRTYVYRMQGLGYFENGGPMARVEAVIDTNLGRPRIVFWRDLTELGRGFELPRAEGQ